ncbi:putative leucine-rich repeat-containing protein DDB_G0290503 [Cardiocondyla obscurior]
MKNNFQPQLYQLNERESRPNIALKKFGQELDKAETKCFALKSELNYMIDVYSQKAQTEIKENKEASNLSLASLKNSGLKFSIKHDCDSEIADAFNLSPRSCQFPPAKNISDNNEKSKSLIQQKELMNIVITPRTEADKKLFSSITTIPIQKQISDKEYESYYFPSSIPFEKASPRPMVRDSEDIEGAKVLELNLNMPDIARTRLAKKSKSRTGRNKINSVCRIDSTVSRKRKMKSRSSISKSTVTTRDTNFIGRKDTKKHRRIGNGVLHQRSRCQNQFKKANDVVEIFHNNRLQKKNSKTDIPKNKKRSHLPKIGNLEKQETSISCPRDKCTESDNHECQFYDKENKSACHSQALNCQNNSEVTLETVQDKLREQDKSEKHPDDLGSSVQDKIQCCERALSKYDNSQFIPSYELPTLASKLKRSSRSYLTRFSFRNIPFVVGTSVTPSYNLGLNIQQVLSVMKIRQPSTSDVTPLLIQKVSRGVEPMSILQDHMNGYEELVFDVNSQISRPFNNGKNLKQDKKSSAFSFQHTRKTQSGASKISIDVEEIPEKENVVSKRFHTAKGDLCDRKIKQQFSLVINKSNTLGSLQNQQGISKNHISDHEIRMPDSQNSKKIRDVLINLHDQFEEMNTKYEKFQSEVKKSNDKSLLKDLQALEKELNAKEEEINAVVGLYKEVMTLKRQIKLNEKNSLVYVATEQSPRNSFSLSIAPKRFQPTSSAQIFGRRTRDLPTSMQLAALLRRIQAFHKQLQLLS